MRGGAPLAKRNRFTDATPIDCIGSNRYRLVFRIYSRPSRYLTILLMDNLMLEGPERI